MGSKWLRAMAKPLPAGWSPRVGDRVWMPRRKPYLRSATGVVTFLLLPGFFEAAYSAHGVTKRVQLGREDVRPWIPPKKRKGK